MTNTVAAILLVLAALLAVSHGGGVNGRALFVFSFLATMIGVAWYFHTRRGKPPSPVEVAAAYIWLCFRRLVGFAAALLFLAGAYVIGFTPYHRVSDGPVHMRAIGVMVMLVLAAFCIWVAIYGQGSRRGAWRDDVELHNENKERYKWRW